MTSYAAPIPQRGEVSDVAHRRLLDTDGEPMPPTSERQHNGQCAEVRVALSRLDDLEAWQERQNGSLQRIEKTVGKVYTANLTLAGTIIVALIGAMVALIKLV